MTKKGQLYHDTRSRTDALDTEAIRDHYDGFDWAYRHLWGEHLHHGLFRDGREKPRAAQEELLRYCATRAGLCAGWNVADVGCGYGATARFLASEYSCSVLGLTLSPAQFRAACRLQRFARDPGSVRFELADAEKYCFPASSFDLVWNLESLGHFFHKGEYLTLVRSALRPGGRFMLADWTGTMENPLVRRIAEKFLCPDLWTAEEYGESLRLLRMRVISCESIARDVARTWEICSERLRFSGWLLKLLPQRFRAFRQGVELMREGLRSGELDYTVLVAEKS